MRGLFPDVDMAYRQAELERVTRLEAEFKKYLEAGVPAPFDLQKQDFIMYINMSKHYGVEVFHEVMTQKNIRDNSDEFRTFSPMLSIIIGVILGGILFSRIGLLGSVITTICASYIVYRLLQLFTSMLEGFLLLSFYPSKDRYLKWLKKFDYKN